MSSAPSALITGITGQDGSFLAELLLEKGYRVTGLIRGGEPARLGCSEHLRERIELVRGDLLDPRSLRTAIEGVRPRELYHLAAPSFVPASWRAPGETTRAIVGSCASILETVRDLDRSMRVFVAASGAMFGDAPESPQREDTPCRPTNPYAISKLAAHQLVGALRGHEQLHASSGITFNHESERRPEQFVTRRITRAAAAISLGLATEVTLGSLQAVRDWSFAGDIVYGAWLMLQQGHAADYVLASGVGHTVADLARVAFACVGLDAEEHVRVDSELVRAPEATANVGDPAKARAQLGWRPRVGFEELVERMVSADVRSLRAQAERGGSTPPRPRLPQA
ncbi:MAG TPA: GDP-mannose 4,6-dehydratase [Solirubrobacteraceae bacterium]|nr:GDP-mannose 4,6-dehydratase [Solirubrobacteraceae bacterium]